MYTIYFTFVQIHLTGGIIAEILKAKLTTAENFLELNTDCFCTDTNI